MGVELVAMAKHVWSDFGESIVAIKQQGTLEAYNDAGIVAIFFGIVVSFVFLLFFITEIYYREKKNRIEKEKLKIKKSKLEKFYAEASSFKITNVEEESDSNNNNNNNNNEFLNNKKKLYYNKNNDRKMKMLNFV